jgi:hypothetical protein
MGLRISRLSDTQIEMIIPARTRNLNEQKQMHEGALTTAAIEAAKILWMRHAPMGHFEVNVSKVDSHFFKIQTEDCRVRMELSETTREVVLSELREQRETKSETELKIFDEHDQAIAELRLSLNFKHQPALG